MKQHLHSLATTLNGSYCINTIIPIICFIDLSGYILYVIAVGFTSVMSSSDKIFLVHLTLSVEDKGLSTESVVDNHFWKIRWSAGDCPMRCAYWEFEGGLQWNSENIVFYLPIVIVVLDLPKNVPPKKCP